MLNLDPLGLRLRKVLYGPLFDTKNLRAFRAPAT